MKKPDRLHPGDPPKSEPNLTVNEVAKCVMARIRRDKTRYQANFSIAVYGTWTKAMEAGREWVKEQTAKLPPAMSYQGGPNEHRDTKSGFPGIRLLSAQRKGRGRGAFETNTYHWMEIRWLGRWAGCPIKEGITFSVLKYGDETAFLLAYLARKWRTVDRDLLLSQVDDFKRSKEGRAVLDRKVQFQVVDIKEPSREGPIGIAEIQSIWSRPPAPQEKNR